MIDNLEKFKQFISCYGFNTIGSPWEWRIIVITGIIDDVFIKPDDIGTWFNSLYRTERLDLYNYYEECMREGEWKKLI